MGDCQKRTGSVVAFCAAAALVGCWGSGQHQSNPPDGPPGESHPSSPTSVNTSTPSAEDVDTTASNAATPTDPTGASSFPSPLPAAQATQRPAPVPTGLNRPGAAPTTEAATLPGDQGNAASLPFRPADFEPPFERSASPGDGKWTPVGEAGSGELSAATSARLFTSTVHPHKTSRFKKMNIVAIDLTRLGLFWTIGAADQGADQLAAHMTPGLVAQPHQARAVAIFNGGFLARHGRWGQMSHGVTVVAPRDNGCTLAIGQDAAVKIEPWGELESSQDMRSFRQGPPCLLHDGAVHPGLLAGNARLWAGRSEKRRTRRRSAVGIDSTGKTMFYAVGTETEAIDLARGMKAVGAVNAMQLDINWNWTRFLLVGRRDGNPRVTSSLIEGMAYGKSEYFSRPSQRDFFLLIER